MPDNDRPRLVIASRNPGKAREFRRLLADVPFDVVSAAEAGVDVDVEETGATFEANARLKAEAYSRASGELTLADDSGIEVDALGGEPGVRSARHAREGQTDEEGRERLLARVRDVPGWERGARYRVVLAVTGPQTGGEVHFFEGVCEGSLAHEPIGEGGFGYDPIFWLPGERRTMAELTPAEKDAVSHRGMAARKAAAFLEKLSGGG